MSIVALCSVKSSPGVTTALLALAAVWPTERSVLLVEADPDGGDLAARTRLPTQPGLTSLAAAGRRTLTADDVDRHTQRLSGEIRVLVGPPGADETVRALEMIGSRLATSLADTGDRDVLVDCGRLRPGAPTTPFLGHAEQIVLVAHPRLDELQHVQTCLSTLTDSGPVPVLVLVGDQPYAPHEVATVLDVRVVGVLADDPSAATILNGHGGNPTRLRRSALIRTAREVVPALLADPRVEREPPVSPRPTPRNGEDAREPSVSHDRHRAASPWTEAVRGRRSPESMPTRVER